MRHVLGNGACLNARPVFAGVGTVSGLAAISGIQRQDGDASIDRWIDLASRQFLL
jgi:hypothetical protein